MEAKHATLVFHRMATFVKLLMIQPGLYKHS
jgi:hypothetical protein